MKHVDVDVVKGELRISLKIVLPILSAIIGTTIWMNNGIMDLKRGQANCWSIDDQSAYVHKMETMNPTIKLPYVLDVVRETRHLP